MEDGKRLTFLYVAIISNTLPAQSSLNKRNSNATNNDACGDIPCHFGGFALRLAALGFSFGFAAWCFGGVASIFFSAASRRCSASAALNS